MLKLDAGLPTDDEHIFIVLRLGEGQAPFRRQFEQEEHSPGSRPG